MNRRLFWKLCLVIATGVVALFYLINHLTTRTEEGMSLLALQDRQQLTQWGEKAEQLYQAGDLDKLNAWLNELQTQENTWVTIASYDIEHIAGDKLKERFYTGYNLGRSVDWKIHLYFEQNPVMELPFSQGQTSLLIQLPNRMRPGTYWQYTEATMQIIVPTILLALLSYFLYRYIMRPLQQMQLATRHFSAGDYDVRAATLMGNRNDEFADLALAFDQMAIRIGEQLISQRQLIADLSHELRTPLTRLDIALASAETSAPSAHFDRISRESKHIRKLVEDTLTLAWLENEQPKLQSESLELTDLLDVVIDDAKFEFPKVDIQCELPASALIEHSSHRAAGQAIENILRNALRYTPNGKSVMVKLKDDGYQYLITIEDQGPGVPHHLLNTIFNPFFRVDKSRERDGSSFGLGLALAKRQLLAIRGQVTADNRIDGGLCMTVVLPKV
ncbi:MULTISPECIES: sensor histidine kinase [unclassified Shewanella]|uniref:sensor histidine kinase n=1 Tax=unclassified Shewanella TaxID=196818 RepID=UPI0017877B1B|nr:MULTISPECIES: sensor histidine kinase [unclassified Shewanella]GIU50915.1 sensor protein PfeS [Shewanella sp. KT0246]